MIKLHSCSYYCERPDCIKTQRDEMREKAEAENATLREWESRCAVALGVPGCATEEMLNVIDSLRENLDALLQKQMDITLKEYKRAEKAEAENAALRGLLERAKWMELYGEIVAEKNK